MQKRPDSKSWKMDVTFLRVRVQGHIGKNAPTERIYGHFPNLPQRQSLIQCPLNTAIEKRDKSCYTRFRH
jgi:hypothetical protein